ncbi:MAG: cyclase family protein [Egibacteraceae bacterium]
MGIRVRQLAAAGFVALVATGIVASRARTRNSTAAAGPGPLPGFAGVVFLSHVNDPKTTPLYPGDPQFRVEPAFTIERDGFFLNLVTEGEHTGTHYGAPCHFNRGERCADELDARDFFRPAVVIDVRRQAAADADYEVTVADLQRFERQHGRIPDGAAVIAWTGWADKWGTPAYPNLDDHGHLHQPGFGLAAAQWLLANRALGALGTDTFGPDASADTEFRVSSLVLHGHRLTLENLAGLDQMPPTGGWLVVGGTRNRHGSGSPATIFGLVP